jgi:hypothetical protein
LDVIEYAWTKLTGAGLTHLFSTKLWNSIDEVDDFMIHAAGWSALLNPAQLATTSCDGFWSLVRTAQGKAIAMEWYNRLTAAQFTTTYCGGFWSLLGTTEGQSVAMEWYDRLTTSLFNATAADAAQQAANLASAVPH